MEISAKLKRLLLFLLMQELNYRRNGNSQLSAFVGATNCTRLSIVFHLALQRIQQLAGESKFNGSWHLIRKASRQGYRKRCHIPRKFNYIRSPAMRSKITCREESSAAEGPRSIQDPSHGFRGQPPAPPKSDRQASQCARAKSATTDTSLTRHHYGAENKQGNPTLGNLDHELYNASMPGLSIRAAQVTDGRKMELPASEPHDRTCESPFLPAMYQPTHHQHHHQQLSLMLSTGCDHQPQQQLVNEYEGPSVYVQCRPPSGCQKEMQGQQTQWKQMQVESLELQSQFLDLEKSCEGNEALGMEYEEDGTGGNQRSSFTTTASSALPRYKRPSHIHAEHRRRGKIQRGFDQIQETVPTLQSSKTVKHSKATILLKSAEYIQELTADCKQQKAEMESLQREMDNLQKEIVLCQEQLPSSGVNTVEKPRCIFEHKIEHYLRTSIAKHWKFWIFSFILRPLSQTFLQHVRSTSKEDICQSIQNWSDENLTLVNLRPIVVTLLRSMSSLTSILTEPGKLQEEIKEMTDCDVKLPFVPVTHKD